MPSVCLYLQIHQPHRLRRYSVFDTEPAYFDLQRNTQLINHLSDHCYVPMTRLLLDLARKHKNKFRFALSLSGCVADLLQQHRADVVKLLQSLVETGCVELLGETYFHSLSFLHSRDEFKAQVDLHAKLMRDLFGQTPRVFRHTELIYNNELASYLHGLGRYKGVIAESVDHVLNHRPPTRLYHPPTLPDLKLLLRHSSLSDDIASRFSNHRWSEFPLTADKFANWVSRTTAGGDVCNLFLEYETFGVYQPADTGIFQFLTHLPAEIFKTGANDFKTPSQCIEAYKAADEYDAQHVTSWASGTRDLSPWLGNAMQSNALHELYKLEPVVKSAGDKQMLSDWRKLTSSDHVYYMSTKYFAHAGAHKYFNPYESPYDAYINFMNVLDNLRTRAETTRQPAKQK